jgi:hypothetical protein
MESLETGVSRWKFRIKKYAGEQCGGIKHDAAAGKIRIKKFQVSFQSV